MISKLERYIMGGIAGGTIGAAVGAIGGAYGGYEIGTAINHYYNIQSLCGRITLDAVVMGVAAITGVEIGATLGGGAGALFTTALYYIVKRKGENDIISYHIQHLKDAVGRNYDKKLSDIYQALIMKDKQFTNSLTAVMTNIENFKEHVEKCDNHDKKYYESALRIKNELMAYIKKSREKAKSNQKKIKELHKNGNHIDILKIVSESIDKDLSVISQFDQRFNEVLSLDLYTREKGGS